MLTEFRHVAVAYTGNLQSQQGSFVCSQGLNAAVQLHVPPCGISSAVCLTIPG